MALLRNLRNILQADVSAGHVDHLCIRLADPDQVAKSKQLPFRFLSAYREMKGVQSLYTAQVLTALETAVKASVVYRYMPVLRPTYASAPSGMLAGSAG